MDVRVDGGPQDGTILVTWIPVQQNTGTVQTKLAPVTGYAVFADGKRVTDVDSPSSKSFYSIQDSLLYNVHAFFVVSLHL